MTLQDYINWLYCYMDKEDQLPYNHLRNLEKLKMGKELKEEAERICGKAAKPKLSDEIVAVVKWVDGTIIDSIRKVEK